MGWLAMVTPRFCVLFRLFHVIVGHLVLQGLLSSFFHQLIDAFHPLGWKGFLQLCWTVIGC